MNYFYYQYYSFRRVFSRKLSRAETSFIQIYHILKDYNNA